MRSSGLAAAVATVLWGCAPQPRVEVAHVAVQADDLRIADADFDREPSAVSGADAARDLEIAVRAFDEAYAGIEGGPRVPSPSAIDHARAVLEARARWEPAELAETLAALFRQPDGHLAFGWDGRAPLRLPAWPLPQKSRAHDNGFAIALFAGETAAPRASMLAGLTSLRPPTTIAEAPHACDEEDRSARSLAPVALVPGSIPRLVIRTFDSAAAESLERLPAIARRLRDLPAFVVDLRGNGGGNFGFAERFVLELTDATLRRLDEREVVSVAAAEGRANSARRRLALGEVPPAAEPVFRTHVAALEAQAAALRARGAGRTEIEGGGFVHGRAPGPLRARVVLLVDGGCASACEMTVALARQIPGVIVAGESTRGSMAAGELALFRLPRSGISVTLGTRAFHDPFGSFMETRGFAPDIEIGADAEARVQTLVHAVQEPAPPAHVELRSTTRVCWQK